MTCAITKRSSSASHDGYHTLILVIPVSLWYAPDSLSHWPSWWVSPLDQRARGCPGTALRGVKAVLHFSDWVVGLPPHIHFLLCSLYVQWSFPSYNLKNIYCLFLRWTKFSAEMVVGHWTRFPRDVVPAPILSEVKEHRDNALNHMA